MLQSRYDLFSKGLSLSADYTLVSPYRRRGPDRAELFNAFNTPQFSHPGDTLRTGTFGRVTGTAADNRQIQMALKYLF